MVPLIAFRCNYGADYFSLGITPITDGTSTYLEHYEAISPKITREKDLPSLQMELQRSKVKKNHKTSYGILVSTIF